MKQYWVGQDYRVLEKYVFDASVEPIPPDEPEATEGEDGS